MKKTSIAFLLTLLPTLSYAAPISGTVVDENNEPVWGASIHAILTNGSTTQIMTTGEDGRFLYDNPGNRVSKIKISFIGYTDKIIPVSQLNNSTISLSLNADVLEAVNITSCRSTHQKYNIATDKCEYTECESARYELTNTSNAKFCQKDNTICTGACTDFCSETTATIQIGTCTDKVGTDCRTSDSNAESAENEWNGSKLVCTITSCKNGFTPSDDKTSCVCPNDGYEIDGDQCKKFAEDCKKTEIPEHATKTHRTRKGNVAICVVDECGDGFKLDKDANQCVCPKSDGMAEKDGKCEKIDDTPTLTPEQQKQIDDLNQQEIDELQKNYDDARANEQSTANKLLGATGMATVGIGGMQALSALSEQRADEAAELDMTAYLATFRCNYGDGQNFAGGTTDIELSGGNELINLYTEYITLATDLRTRKDAMGMSPGVESEVLFDKATTGLYDDVGTGRRDGVFASLARALSDPNSADAAEWAAQREASAKKLKTGATMAIGGLATTFAADKIINRGKGDKSAEITAKYEKLRNEIRQDLKPIEDNSKKKQARAPETEIDKMPVLSQPEDTSIKLGNTLPTTDLPIPEGETIEKMSSLLELPTNTPVTIQAQKVITPIISLYNESLFASGSVKLKSDLTDLDETIELLKKYVTDNNTDKFLIKLMGHTDKDKIKQNSKLCKPKTGFGICDNDTLGWVRATEVRKYMIKKWPKSEGHVLTCSMGDKNATGKTAQEKAEDRRVDFYIIFDDEPQGDCPYIDGPTSSK